MRLIDADVLIISDEECVNTMCRNCKMHVVGCEDFKHILENAPTIEERKTGMWIDMGDFEQCSVCTGTHLKEVNTVYGKAIWIKSAYCPSCGARMESGA